MSINDFAVLVAQKEGLKVSMKIGQVKEQLRIVNELLDGELYRLIRKLER